VTDSFGLIDQGDDQRHAFSTPVFKVLVSTTSTGTDEVGSQREDSSGRRRQDDERDVVKKVER